MAGDRGRRVDKPWGHELIWAETERYVGKIISIAPGKRLSLQKHLKKDESVLVLRGTLRLHLQNEAGEIETHDLVPGEHSRVHVGRIHRFEALEETVEVVEVSSPELDDVVRLEDDYSREGTSRP